MSLVIDVADAGLDSPQSFAMPSPPLSPSSPTGVRPQWTPRTSAGRAKLMAESANWEAAQHERELQRARDRQIDETTLRQRQVAAARAEQTKQALQHSREQHAGAIARAARKSKEDSDAWRQRSTTLRESWQGKARAIPRIFAETRTPVRLRRSETFRVRVSWRKVHTRTRSACVDSSRSCASRERRRSLSCSASDSEARSRGRRRPPSAAG